MSFSAAKPIPTVARHEINRISTRIDRIMIIDSSRSEIQHRWLKRLQTRNSIAVEQSMVENYLIASSIKLLSKDRLMSACLALGWSTNFNAFAIAFSITLSELGKASR